MTIEQWSLKVRWILTKKEALRSRADYETHHTDGWLTDYLSAQEELDKQIQELMDMRIE